MGWTDTTLRISLYHHCHAIIWSPLFLDPSDGVFSLFDLAAHLWLPHLQIWFVRLSDPMP